MFINVNIILYNYIYIYYTYISIVYIYISGNLVSDPGNVAGVTQETCDGKDVRSVVKNMGQATTESGGEWNMAINGENNSAP